MENPPFSWTCPYCNNQTTINEPDYSADLFHPFFSGRVSKIISEVIFIKCPNPECNQIHFSVALYRAVYQEYEWIPSENIKYWQLLPQSKSKKFPSYIPEPIINDYEEACQIVDMSPKASATLSRRCLQGMIRDFWGISERNLYQEINAIEDKVEPLTWQAIQSMTPLQKG